MRFLARDLQWCLISKIGAMFNAFGITYNCVANLLKYILTIFNNKSGGAQEVSDHK